MSDMILTLDGIVKAYPGVLALNGVSLEVQRGEIHALLGENGAGKSTMIKMITGAECPDQGTICFEGNSYKKLTPAQAQKMGIGVIYQEFSLIDAMSVADNIFISEKKGHLINRKDLNHRAAELIRRFHMDLDPSETVRNLSPAKKQIVEILKALSRDVKLLIMDEPTAPLSVKEVESLFGIVKELKAQGITIIYISHRLQELFEISDRVSVFRDGAYVKTLRTQETTRKELISLMVGRELNDVYPAHETKSGEVVLELQNVYGNGDADISFRLHRGEILGLGGLVGAGRTELAGLLSGSAPLHKGKILVHGKEAVLRSPAQALRYGICLIPEDRRNQGCLQKKSIAFNLVLSALKRISEGLVINKRKERKVLEDYSRKLVVKAASLEHTVSTLSGGNQQKVVIARALAAQSEIFIFDEPTRGIDVGAKHEIYQIMADLAAEGKAILMISSEMPELLGMSDRILVLAEGRIRGELEKEEFSQEQVLELASI